MAEKTESFYDAVAEGYEQQYHRENLGKLDEYPANYHRLQIVVRQLLACSAKSLYEVGVGEGTPLAVLAAMGLDVAGCDISQKMVDKAKESFKKHKLDPNLIRWGDIEDVITIASQLKDKTFDAAMALGVLPHVEKDILTLKNLATLVRPGGRVFVEFRNKFFSLFTFNRYTAEFIFDDLLANVPMGIKDKIRPNIEKRLEMDKPPARLTLGGGSAPGMDAIRSKFHNPIDLVETFRACGFSDPRIHWYHYHATQPFLEREIGQDFRTASMALEHEGTWRGMFLCSAGVMEAVRAG